MSTAACRVRAWESRASSAARATICSATWLSWRFSGRHCGSCSGCMPTALRSKATPAGLPDVRTMGPDVRHNLPLEAPQAAPYPPVGVPDPIAIAKMCSAVIPFPTPALTVGSVTDATVLPACSGTDAK